VARQSAQRQLGDRRHRAGRASIVERDVKAAKAADRRLDQGLGQSLISDVARDGDGVAAAFLNFRDEGIELRPTARGHHDFCACLCEQLRRGEADAGACPRDNGNLVDQCGHLVISSGVLCDASRAWTWPSLCRQSGASQERGHPGSCSRTRCGALHTAAPRPRGNGAPRDP
jgi:hypothetical protein